VHHRTDSCNPTSDYMQHRMRRSLHEREKIGVSVQTLQWIREGVSIPFQNNRPPPRFNQGVSLLDATPAQLELVNRELARFVQAGAWEPSTCNEYVSRLFLVPQPGNNQWRPKTKGTKTKGIEQAPRGSKILERRGRTSTHYLEEVEGRPSRCREFLAAAGRPQRPPIRGQ
jgi:hypothetical protein